MPMGAVEWLCVCVCVCVCVCERCVWELVCGPLLLAHYTSIAGSFLSWYQFSIIPPHSPLYHPSIIPSHSPLYIPRSSPPAPPSSTPPRSPPYQRPIITRPPTVRLRPGCPGWAGPRSRRGQSGGKGA